MKKCLIVVLCVALLAGCNARNGVSLSDTSAANPTLSGNHTNSIHETDETIPLEYQYPTPPSTLATQQVKEVALEYEQAFLYHQQLKEEHIGQFDARGTYGGRSAMVITRKENSVVVAVELGYTYVWSCHRTDPQGGNDAHFVSKATYQISNSKITRIEGTGISPPCVPTESINHALYSSYYR